MRALSLRQPWGEEAWKGSLAPIAGVSEPLCPFCGEELVVNPDLGKPDPAPAPAPAPEVEERAPWEVDPEAWKAGS